MKLMFRFIKRHVWMFLTALAFLTLETFADLLQPTFMSYIVDKGIAGKDISTILMYGGIMLGIAALGALGAVVRNIYASKTSQIIGKELRLTIYEKVQSLSFENIDRLQPSSIITRITNDVTQILNFLNGIMRIMLKAPITCIGAIVLIIIQMPKMLPLMIAILVIGGILIYSNMRLGYPRFGTLQRKLDKLNGTSREFLSAIRVVKAFRAEKEEQEKFEKASEDFAVAGIAAMRVMAIFGPLINFTVNLGVVIMLWMADGMVSDEIGRLIACVNYMTQVAFSLGMVSMILNSAVRAIASSARVQEILDEVPVQENIGNTGSQIMGSLDFENVSFTYAGTARPAISDVNFSVKVGETIGIIGPTGSGKSSLVNLVPRFYDATEGVLKIDGKDIKELGMDEVRKAIAVVPQKALLFSGSISQNLRWGDKNATDEMIREAAKIACADSFIEGFPDGYETQLGQGGVNVSGGQKQRLSIARALLKKPRILILDDSTSALDATTESIVLENIRKQASDITVLLVSQRISTVMKANHILCMEDGCVKGFGSHEELMKKCEAYMAIYKSQIGGEAIAQGPDIKEGGVAYGRQ